MSRHGGSSRKISHRTSGMAPIRSSPLTKHNSSNTLPTPTSPPRKSTQSTNSSFQCIILVLCAILIVLFVIFIATRRGEASHVDSNVEPMQTIVEKVAPSLQSHQHHLVQVPQGMFEKIRAHTRTILDFGVRVPHDTPGYKMIKEYLVKVLGPLHNSRHYFHEFTAHTPYGFKNFANFIVEFGDRSVKRKEIIFAAHYESKLFPSHPHSGKEFLGATDSVVSCAMLFELAKWLDEEWNNIGSKLPFHVTFVFFDGEEAFKDWSATDSIYGARALAKKWEDEGRIGNIELFILLDLIGHEDVKLYKFAFHPDRYHEMLLTSQGQVDKDAQYFQSRFLPQAFIEDDHTPFVQRNVPTIHMIPVPFPPTWHTYDDDWDHIDWKSVEKIQHTLLQFVKNLIG